MDDTATLKGMAEPAMPAVPGKSDPGRLCHPGQLAAHWPCRWCGQLLHWRHRAIICLRCDLAEPTP